VDIDKDNRESRRCQHRRKDGKRCNAVSMLGSRFCFFHNPERKKEQEDARKKGGRQGRMAALGKNAPNIQIKSPDDLIVLLSETISQVRRGEIDPRIANAIGYLSGVLLKAREQGEIEDRLTIIENEFKRGLNNHVS
jgi:hypothetical protein